MRHSRGQLFVRVLDAVYDLVSYRSVQKYPCGISVNVIPHRHQPKVFWKEMLRDLMHSMSMSMVRDKSVGSFMDRLHKGVQINKSRMRLKGNNFLTSSCVSDIETKDGTERPDGVVHGWIELRKGFFSLLTENGDLVIFKSSVLINASGRKDGSRDKPEVGFPRDFALSISSERENYTVDLCNWRVNIKTCRCSADSTCVVCDKVDRARLSHDPTVLLEGSFAYNLYVPVLAIEANPAAVSMVLLSDQAYRPEAQIIGSNEANKNRLSLKSKGKKKISGGPKGSNSAWSPHAVKGELGDVEDVLMANDMVSMFETCNLTSNNSEQPSYTESNVVRVNDGVLDLGTKMPDLHDVDDVADSGLFEITLDNHTFVGVDPKLKAGLPFLVAVARTKDKTLAEQLEAIKYHKKGKQSVGDFITSVKLSLYYSFVVDCSATASCSH
jgi:hypothetical protein